MTTHKSIGRCGFLGGLATAELTIATTVPASIPAHAAPGTPIRAAVLEFNDPWTKATGVGELLRRSGATVTTIDPSPHATSQGAERQVRRLGHGLTTPGADPAGVDHQRASMEDDLAALERIGSYLLTRDLSHGMFTQTSSMFT
ncbi:hypothetical protein [Paenarthrobacter sp. FR1]|uniref:hypothetical protein n=1 Tax=Paenarthrobacter sp. FR1 TaxID=3439548 RepID=UPI003DA2ADB5